MDATAATPESSSTLASSSTSSSSPCRKSFKKGEVHGQGPTTSEGVVPRWRGLVRSTKTRYGSSPRAVSILTAVAVAFISLMVLVVAIVVSRQSTGAVSSTSDNTSPPSPPSHPSDCPASCGVSSSSTPPPTPSPSMLVVTQPTDRPSLRSSSRSPSTTSLPVSPSGCPAACTTPVSPAPASPTTAPASAPSPRPTSTSSPSSAPVPVRPTAAPSASVAPSSSTVTFLPGVLNATENGLRLSSGLTSRVVARSGQRARYSNGSLSGDRVHVEPDFGACFSDTIFRNPGGWIYVSNSEDRNKSRGGVGAFTFDSSGNLIKYEMLLTKTTANCGGGVTPWETWISCEETSGGVNWQVDPLGVRPPQVITLGNDGGGKFESFAYDLVAGEGPQFFVTEDEENGPLRRWRPLRADWSDPWSILTGNGTTDYLLIHPENGTFSWTGDKRAAQRVALRHFPNSEGIDASNGVVYFVTKELKRMYILNLRTLRYTSQPTNFGDFDGQPDQVVRVYRDDYDLLFFTEDGGDRPGIYAHRTSRSADEVLTILESSVYVNADQETTGLAFSPDRRRMYFAIQDAGIIYEVRRIDGLPFDGRSLNVQYNNVNARSRHRFGGRGL